MAERRSFTLLIPFGVAFLPAGFAVGVVRNKPQDFVPETKLGFSD